MEETPRYEVQHHSTRMHNQEQTIVLKVRRNGKVFYIILSTWGNYAHSPRVEAQHLACFHELRKGDEIVGDEYERVAYDQLLEPLKPLLVELAPSPREPQSLQITMQEHLFPETIFLDIEIVDEIVKPRLIFPSTSSFIPFACHFTPEAVASLTDWTHIYRPTQVKLSFPKNPEDALFKQPKKVLVNNGDDGLVECFYKPCSSLAQCARELNTYKAIAAAHLYDKPGLVKLCRLHGVVAGNDLEVFGLLLSYIDCADVSLSMKFQLAVTNGPPSVVVRNKWARQLDATLQYLHEAGIVWGNVAAENILIDGSDDAWIVDFGGGGGANAWVDEGLSGTISGDCQGMIKIQRLLAQLNVV